jgi:diguanylate cyclase (GGDEF)-like protein
MTPDIYSVWLIGALSSLSFGFLILVLERIYPPHLRSAVILWGASSVCLGTSYTIRLENGWHSPFVFHVVSATLTAICLSLEWRAIRELKHRAVSTLSVLAVPFLMFAFGIWFTAIDHNVTKQLLIFNILNLAMMLLIAQALLQKDQDRHPFPDLIVGFVYLLLSCVTFAVIADYIRVGVYPPEYDFNRTRSTFNGVAAIVATEVAFPLFLLMLSERLNRSLIEQAMRDPLTGLVNRRAFDEIGFREISGASRTGNSLSVLMIDIDHFKHVNDKYGHAAGDALLVAVAAALRGSLRDEDYLCRWGGDEFCALLPRADADHAKNVAERVLCAFKDFQFTRPGKIIDVAISVSIGITTNSGAPQNLDALIEKADRALYQAKEAGRGQYAFAAPAAASPNSPC